MGFEGHLGSRSRLDGCRLRRPSRFSSVSGLRSENLEVVLTVKYSVPTFSSLTLGLVTLFVLPFFVPMINFQQDLIVELYGGCHLRQRFTRSHPWLRATNT
jgi:hypothetical protein